MRSLNKVCLMGNLGNDPEVRATAGGGKVASFSLATSRTWTDQSGTKQEKTEWHKCVAWNQGTLKLADVAQNYCKKGKAVYVEGSLEYRQYQDKEGVTRYVTEVKIRELILLGGGDGGTGPNAAATRAPAARAAHAVGAAQPVGAGAGGEFDDFPEDDEEDPLPF